MPLAETSSHRRDAEYYYRRPLRLHELLPAIGVAVGAGLFAFYVTRILLQRTPLTIERGGADERGRRSATPGIRKHQKMGRPARP